MVRLDRSETIYTATEVAIILTVAIIVTSIGYLIFSHPVVARHVTSHISHASSASAPKTAANTSNQETAYSKPYSGSYSGWKTTRLKYEKLSLKYPTGWNLTESSTKQGTAGTVNPGSDQLVLTSPTTLTVRIDTGVLGISGGMAMVLASSPFNILGGHYYLDFYSNTSSDLAQGACIGTVVANNAAYPDSKNISAAITGGGSPLDVVCIDYSQDSLGYIPRKTVSAIESDLSFNDAKGIIQSLVYY